MDVERSAGRCEVLNVDVTMGVEASDCRQRVCAGTDQVCSWRRDGGKYSSFKCFDHGGGNLRRCLPVKLAFVRWQCLMLAKGTFNGPFSSTLHRCDGGGFLRPSAIWCRRRGRAGYGSCARPTGPGWAEPPRIL